MKKPDWMDGAMFSIYQQIADAQARAKRERSRLVPKLKNKTATIEESKRIKDLNRTINELESKKLAMDRLNPTHPKTILKTTRSLINSQTKTKNK